MSVNTFGRAFRISALVIAVGFFSAACSGEEELSRVTAGSVSGTWTGGNGGTMTLQADHRFSTSGIDWGTASAGSGCPRGEGDGIWAFWGSDPDSPETSSALEKYTEGDTVNLSFNGVEQGSCLINLNVIEGGSTLCVSDDIEVPCSLDLRFTKAGADAGRKNP
ncbi:hypothetical protein [Streptomyces zaomyceticus]|uniref:hypothetical protein n=1 Tax=Streptomyces zaomyceticus TaxID=68286 RepID=UPI00167A2C7E|nr:hypothetical protein [Streptomyces zaomyceticus]GHG05468.1 lipoprotein [Streptomyces zaomyceticus]